MLIKKKTIISNNKLFIKEILFDIIKKKKNLLFDIIKNKKKKKK
jgi:hypothetical protein